MDSDGRVSRPKVGGALKSLNRISPRTRVDAVLILAWVSTTAIVFQVTTTFLNRERMRNVWAILYLDLEHQAELLSNQIAASGTASLDQMLVAEVDKAAPANVVSTYEVQENGNLKPLAHSVAVPEFHVVNDLGAENFGGFERWNIVEATGRRFLIGARSIHPHQDIKGEGRPERKQRLIHAVFVTPYLTKIGIASPRYGSTSATTYIATRTGNLLYTNDPSINQANFRERKLVQRFIGLPVSTAGLELEDEHVKEFYGFFTQIPDTNLVVFAEMPKAVVLKDSRLAALKACLAASCVVLLLFGFLRVILLRSLMKLLEQEKAPVIPFVGQKET